MNGRSSTFGGFVGYLILIGLGIAGVIGVWQEVIGPIICGVTAGCGTRIYCPDLTTTRAQMAVFLLKASEGSIYTPPPCSGTIFDDVPCTGGPFDPWIEDLATREITGGCGGGNYCPNNPVTRAQMSAFLLKTEQGVFYTPPPCTGTVS